ncbi:recombinase family protein [Microbacterium aureliae]
MKHPKSTTPRRAVTYLRLSRSTEESEAIPRQRADLAALAEREGWDIVAELADDGVSGTKTRDKAVEALRMLRDGEADVLLVWKLDRWSRQGIAAIGELMATLDARPDAVFAAYRDGLRSDQPAWRIVAAVLAEVARTEAENTSARVAAMRDGHLSKTRPEDQRHLGGVPGFGYRAIKSPHGPGKVLVPDDYEVAVVREVADLLIGGATLATATRWLADHDVPTPTSPARRARQSGVRHSHLDKGEWRFTTVRNLWRSETLIGRTTRRVEVTGPDGRPVLERRVVVDALGVPITRWEPIIDADTHRRLRERLPETGRKQARRMASWLSDVVRCAGCGAKLYVQKRDRDGVAPRHFRCRASSGKLDACAAPATVDVDLIEGFIEAAFLDAVGAKPELRREEVVTAPDVARELAEVEAAIADTTSAMSRDDGDEVALFARLAKLKDRRRDLRAHAPAVEVVLVPTGRTMADVWAGTAGEASLELRRELLREVIPHAFITRAAGGNGRAPLGDRILLRWDADHAPEAGPLTDAGPWAPALRFRAA